jgi:GTP cyclohydrolase I
VTAAPLPVHRLNGDDRAQAVPRPALRVVKPPSEVDLVAAEQAAAAFLVDLDTESLAASPAQMARAYAEMFTPRSFDLTTFGNDAAYDELIIARSIPVQSVCEHHLLLFVGVAHVGYLPGGRNRAVEPGSGRRAVRAPAPGARTAHPTSRRLAPRSRSTTRCGGRRRSRTSMHDHAVAASGATTVTSALHGQLRRDAASRAEFFTLIGANQQEMMHHG